VPATFFVIGSRVHSDAQLRRIVEAGFSIGNHLRTTVQCSSLSLTEFRADFDFTDRLLRRFSAPAFFRPPSDLGTAEQLAYVASKGNQPVMGTVFPLDHWIQRPSVLAFLVRRLAVPGGIVIMHDGDVRGRTTAKVLADVLPALKRAGYTFESLDLLSPVGGRLGAGGLLALLCAWPDRPCDPIAHRARPVSDGSDRNGSGTQWHIPGLGNPENTVKVSWLPLFRRVFPILSSRGEGFWRSIVEVCSDVLQSGVVGPISCASSFTINGLGSAGKWWQGPESNRGHKDFQSLIL